MKISLPALLFRLVHVIRYVCYCLVLVVLCYWSVQLVAPPILPTPQVPPSIAPVISNALTWQLFGTKTALTTLPAIELLGIVLSARKTKNSRAALGFNGEKKVVAEGKEIIPGVRLKAIQKNQVILVFQGQEHFLKLPLRTPVNSGGNGTEIRTEAHTAPSIIRPNSPNSLNSPSTPRTPRAP